MAVVEPEADAADEEAADGEAGAPDADADADAGGDSGFSLALGGTFAWNQLTGSIQAHLIETRVDTADGSVVVEANQGSALSAESAAGTAVTSSSGSAAGATLAFNAIGWDMGNIAAAGLNSLLGTDIGTTEKPLAIEAVVERSDLTAGGDVSVTASD